MADAPTLEEQLRQQLTAAMKAKDAQTANLIRMINTKIMERRTAKGFTGVVDDALILDVIATYKKTMEKARAEFLAAGERGAAQIAELDFELAWCAPYALAAAQAAEKMAPKQAGEDELRAAVAAAVAALPTKDPRMAGRIIGTVKKQFGDRADMQLVKKLADEALA